MKVKDLYEAVVNGNIISDIELQRAIVYDAKKQELVIDSLVKGLPLPAFYLWKNEDGKLEVLDGKQRIEAIKSFKQAKITYNGKAWKHYVDTDIQSIIDETDLTIIECEGDEEKKREIFKRINTLGVPLSNFEVLNGLFHGQYLEGLNDYFNADKIIRKIMPNDTIDRGNNRYRFLEYIYYVRHNGIFPKKTELDDYVSARKDTSFQDEINKMRPYVSFIKDVFSEFSSIKAGLRFKLAVKYVKDKSIWLQYKDDIWKECNAFMKSPGYKLSDTKDDDIENMILGIVNNRRVDPKRLFSEEDKAMLLSEQTPNEDGLYVCNKCNNHFKSEELTVDHIIPWSLGGRTELSNAQLLCRSCNSQYGNKQK